MTCISLTETGILALASLICGTFLKMLHDLLQSCRDSRCKRLNICGIKCENEILSGQELVELQQQDQVVNTNENIQV